MRRQVLWPLLVLAVATRAGAVTVVPGFTATKVVEGLSQPTAAAFAPDGRLVVLEKGGRVRLWTAAGGLREEPLLTLPSCTDSEMGLLGLAFDPEFVSNRFLYLYHTHPPEGDLGRCGQGSNAGRRNRVVRVTVADEAIDPSSLVVLVDGLRTDGGNHDGGCLRFGPDGMLYVAVGDTGVGDGGPPGASTNPYAQDLQSREGKILRVDRDGSAPPDNPFAAMGGDAAYVFAYGLRNPFRFAFDPIVPGPQLLWTGDVGQVTWEEIDVVRAGDDLGWPQCEGFEPTSTCPGTSVPPVYVYRHPGASNESVSVTGGVHYAGAQFEEPFFGDYFFGDFGLNQVYRAEVNAMRDGILGAPAIFSNDAGQPVDFFTGPDGALYWVAIGAGAIVRVTQDGRPGAAVGGCERALGAAVPAWIRRATKRLAVCARRGEPCAPPSRFPTRRRARRRIGTLCDAAARARVCARLGCVPCASADDLTACTQRLAATTALDVTAPILSLGSRCAAAAVRAGGADAALRTEAIVDCVEGAAPACIPPPTPPETRSVGEACVDPAPICTALACVPCASSDDLSACVAERAGPPVDALVSTLLGVIR